MSSESLTKAQQVAVQRWKLGHHAFHIYLVSMNDRLARLRSVLQDSEDWSAAPELLRVLARLYDASTASMRYAADFPSAQYDGLIRPSMSPPWLSAGFSGRFNSDHDKMLTALKQLRSTLKSSVRRGEATPEVTAAAAELWRAQSRNRAAHKLICEKFVPGGRSLLKEYFENTAETTQ